MSDSNNHHCTGLQFECKVVDTPIPNPLHNKLSMYIGGPIHPRYQDVMDLFHATLYHRRFHVPNVWMVLPRYNITTTVSLPRWTHCEGWKSVHWFKGCPILHICTYIAINKLVMASPITPYWTTSFLEQGHPVQDVYMSNMLLAWVPAIYAHHSVMWSPMWGSAYTILPVWKSFK